MHYTAKRINILEVLRGDTFHLPLVISSLYPIEENTTVKMQVRPAGDLPDAPILIFDSEGDAPSITIDGQEVTMHKDATEMLTVRPGRFLYDCQFTTGGTTSTLFGGFFEILQDSTFL